MLCFGRPTLVGNTDRGSFSPEKPALDIKDPLSKTRACSFIFLIFCLDVFLFQLHREKTILECRELNPGRQSDSLECYHYTTPDSPFNIGRFVIFALYRFAVEYDY